MLTLAQHRVYRFIQQFVTQYNYSPTTSEIAAGIGIQSRGVVHRYLKALELAGYIDLVPHKKRNIHLRPRVAEKTEFSLPLLGRIAAGEPIEAIHDDETVNVTEMFLTPGRYALRVKGDSMIDEGIQDGDIIICQHANQANNGQIVVALIDQHEATLKRLQTNNDATVSLIPANPNHRIQIYPSHRVTIQGIFIGLLRLSPQPV